MNDKMREALQSTLATLRGIYADPDFEFLNGPHFDMADLEEWEAALSQQPDSEPVYYCRQDAIDDTGGAHIMHHKPVGEFNVPLYATPQPAAQVPEEWRETIASDVHHLGNWLDAHECECEMGHICGRPEVEKTRAELLAMLAGLRQPDPAKVD